MGLVTGYFTHPNCWRHEMGAGHPDCSQRLDAIQNRLLVTVTGLGAALARREATPGALADLKLAHGRMHQAALGGLSDGLRDDRMAGGHSHAQIDPDTSINVHSWNTILVAAIDAIAAVMAGEPLNALCAVRPPGRQAVRNQALGFCFVNNVAVAAGYALERQGLQRLPIVDFDVHHGNGTEDIVLGDERIKDVAQRHAQGHIVRGSGGGLALRSVEVHLRALADV